MNDELTRKWPSTLVELLGIAEEVAQRHVPAETANTLAYDLINAIADSFGGIQTYIPKGDALKRALRDHAIYQEFRQGNADQLARKHGLTEAQIYSIYKTQYQLHIRKIQPSLI